MKRCLLLLVLSMITGGFCVESVLAQTTTAIGQTTTPIKHLIVVIGENHTFDNLFGGYQPRRGQQVSNLLSKGIINRDGSPGPNFDLAAQQTADNTGPAKFSIKPTLTGPFTTLPQPNTTYATGLPLDVPDTRFPDNLPNGPFQITQYVNFSAYVGDPPHRFFQMWQQFDEGALDLFPWVGITASIGPSNDGFSPTPDHPNQGAEAMGFYNMATGDAPYFKFLADFYAMGDNFHQSIMGGTGGNFFAISTGDVAFHTDPDGQDDVPPTNQIENPDAVDGLNNWYTDDGYAGGSYVNCADRQQPGVSAIRDYLDGLPYKPFHGGNCADGHYYLVNNYNPGYTKDGVPQPLGPDHFTLPPQTVPTLAEALSAKGITWKYYSGGRATGKDYCSICDPFTFSKAVMESSLRQKLQDLERFYDDIVDEKTTPAVVFVRPDEPHAGHPANATIADFEDFVANLVARVKNNHQLWDTSAILITMDEGGGYYDSGYIQPLDFFGDGTRIPVIAVSPYAKRGYVDHTYSDHASILKFIERNWKLSPLTERSRDNLPNPITSETDPYVPVNSPAIGDLMQLFVFSHR